MLDRSENISPGRTIGFSIIHPKKGWVSDTSENFGKWIILEKNLEKLRKHETRLNELVEGGKITQVKFYNTKKMNEKGISLLPKRKDSVLMIYCYKNEKEEVKKILNNLKLFPKQWKSNKQTIKDWQPGGELYEEMKNTLPEEKFVEYLKKIKG